MLSHRISKNWGPKGLPDGTIQIKATGSAGQSLGAWLAHGVTIEIEGDANDYVGKGLSGGRIIVYPPKSATFCPEENILIGNVACLWCRPRRGVFPRPGRRAILRPEFGGDRRDRRSRRPRMEYMTGGRAVILGPTGRNRGRHVGRDRLRL